MLPAKETRQEKAKRIVEEYSTMLLRVAINQLGNQNEAEDIVQKVFLKLIKTNPDFDNSEHEKAWLLRVAINECKDLQKSSAKKKNTPLEEGITVEEGADTESRLEIVSAIQKLPAKYRNVIYLFYYEGYTTAEIADILKIKKGTVESQLFRARDQLKDLLEGGWTN